MAIGILETLIMMAVMLFIIFVILLLIWVVMPSPRRQGQGIRKNQKEDLKKIKEQINGDDD